MTATLFIDGAWRAAADGATLAAIDPATEAAFDTVAAGGAADVARAVEAARRALPGWRAASGAERGAILRRFAQAVRDRADALARLEVLDNGKPLPEAAWDIADVAGCFDLYAGLAEGFDARREQPVAVPDARFLSRTRLEPVGVAALIVPWNYPMLMAAWKVAPALAAGCTAVLKPSELTPMSALELGRIALEAGLPAGVLNIVTGGPEAGAALSRHPGVAKIAFTGSVPTGQRVMAAAAEGIKAVSLELGGKSPFIVFADSDIAQAVEWVMFGIFWNQGQVCSATSRVLVEAGLYGRFTEALVEATRRIPMGAGLEPGVKLGPLVSAGQHGKVVDAIARAQHDGARVACGGGRPPGRERGYFMEPTVLLDAPEASAAWREEIFGPVVCVRPFEGEADAIRAANDSPYGLAAAVMSADRARCDRVAAALDAGIVWINCSQPTFMEAPWGGVKHSGFGRELGEWGFQAYLTTKQITTYASAEPWGWYA